MTQVEVANRDLSLLSPEFRKKVNLWLKECDDKIFVTEWYRSQERQEYLYEQWRTRPWQIVTWTKNSTHTTWNAVDIAFKWDVLYPEEFELWRNIADIAKKFGIVWGFDLWNTDKPHFQDNGKPLEDEAYIREKYEIPYLFRWVDTKISLIPSERSERINASYDYDNNCIILYPRFWSHENKAERDLILEHEFCHYIHTEIIHVFHRDDFVKWRKVSLATPETLNKAWYDENAWVSKYAKTNYFEDFAETVEHYIKRKKMWEIQEYWDYRDVKEKVAVWLMRKYTPDNWEY